MTTEQEEKIERAKAEVAGLRKDRARVYQDMARVGAAAHQYLMTVGDCNPQVCINDLKTMRYIQIEMPIGATREDGHKVRRILGVGDFTKVWKNDSDRDHDFMADLTWNGQGPGNTYHVKMEFFMVCRVVGYKEETKQVPVWECDFKRDED